MEQVEKGLEALLERISEQADDDFLVSLLGQIASWVKPGDIDYNLATPESLVKIMENFTLLCGINAEVYDFSGLVKTLLVAKPAAIRRRVL